ncbi:hypothetical protein YC2023_033301 [Brassica napus]
MVWSCSHKGSNLMKVNSRRQNNSIEAAEMIKAFMHVQPGSQVDVIGQVVDLDGIQTVQARGKDEQRVQFRCDASRYLNQSISIHRQFIQTTQAAD